MALIQINADFTRVADSLRRIAEAVERISPPPSARREVKKMQLINVDPEYIAEQEEENDRRRDAGTENSPHLEEQ